MPRKPLIRSQTLPYHVTLRCNNREEFHSPIFAVWNIICNQIAESQHRYQLKVHAFVLMPNHLHMLVSTPNEDLGVIMRDFVASTTKKLNRHAGRTGRVFGKRYHWSLVDHDQYLDSVIKYIYRNPVKARITDNVQTHLFTSLKWLCENHFDFFKLDPTFGQQEVIPNDDLEKFIHWLNQPFQHEQEHAIRLGLKKTRFSPPKDESMKKKVKLDQFRSMNLTR